ncbi:hypothetical protein BDZ85DRAFT_203059 [Elsinoe ampelina]|uniref:Actin-like ATPase domain-containing protein n=1 Tax=Elsinoe ampelina TaxID=302913 RepID=A0A6A6G5V7_9PEZI|nr:hypothetical protein BDZ85DRAFT_203059 [Elsinoe ampelina]
MVRPTDKIVCGIDFGTTFSGFAYCYAASGKDPENVHVIKAWPGGRNLTSDKVPTQMIYAEDGTISKWGYNIEPTDKPLRCIKLLLDHRQAFPSYVSKQELLQLLKEHRKSPTTAVADYLTQILEFAKKDMSEKFSEAMLSTTPVEYVLTVPAVWSDMAKQSTMKAAGAAGLGDKVHLISEPEAAAVHALSAIQKEDLRVGDVFIVCDAGGGTVDLITYEVQSLEPLILREVVPGTGGLCGAAFLNYGFEDYLKSRLGFNFCEGIIEHRPKCWSTAIEYFESYIKRNFDPIDEKGNFEEREFSIPFPGVADDEKKRIDCGFLTVTSSEVAGVFRKIIDQIMELIDDQAEKSKAANKSPKGLILVGGFGQSRYLFKRIKSKYGVSPDPPVTMPPGAPKGKSVFSILPGFKDQSAAGFLVIQPPTAWTAVVRGAVLRGISGRDLVSSRKARRHYGLRLNVRFDPAKHPLSARYWDDYDEVYRAKDQMVWLVQKGDTLLSDDPIQQDVCVVVQSMTGSNETKLYYCGADQAPAQFSGGSASEVLPLCSVSVNLGGISPRFWTTKETPSGKKHCLTYKLGMLVQSGRITFDVRIGGVVYDTVQAKFE